jgi:hypothetical protein
METYQLEKLIWDDGDFEVMGWHDATIWSIHPDPFAHEFSLDLDYIFKWVDPGPGETHFKFWVAPVTMVFENAHTVKIVIDSLSGIIEVADLNRGEPEPSSYVILAERSYRFECQEGKISVRSTGFHMFVRRVPELLGDQHFSLAQRGGVGFERGHSAA